MQRTLHLLAQQEHLTPAQTHELWRLAGVHRPPAEVHRRLTLSLVLVAALLLGAGLIFWVAANWAAQSRTFRLHLLQAAVAVPLVAAWLVPGQRQPVRLALVLLATLALGGLLAYIGMTYQTGADAWQLFATWALLALPGVLVLRSDWLWALWLLIVGTAIGTWSGQSLFNQLGNLLNWRSMDNLFTPLLWLAVFLAPVLAATLGWVRDLQGLPVRPVISLRLVALMALGAWTTMALMHLFNDGNQWDATGRGGWISPGYVLNAAFVMVGGWIGWRSRWRDLAVMGMALLALNVLGLVLLGKWMFEDLGMREGGWLMFAVMAALAVGASGRWLYQQQKEASHAR